MTVRFALDEAMNATVEKRVLLSGQQAQRLEQLATTQNTTENALIEKALNLLFQTQQEEANLPAELQADWVLLRQLEAELGPLPASRPALKMDPAEIVSFVGTPIDPVNAITPVLDRANHLMRVNAYLAECDVVAEQIEGEFDSAEDLQQIRAERAAQLA